MTLFTLGFATGLAAAFAGLAVAARFLMLWSLHPMNPLALLTGWKGYALTAALCLATGFGSCWWLRDQMAAHAQLAAAHAETKAAKVVVARTAKAADITEDVGVKVEAKQEAIRVVYRTIVKEVPVYVPPEVDRRFLVPVGAVRLLNYASQGAVPPAVPDGAGQPVDAPSDVGMSALVGAVSENYGVCLAWREQVIGWQAWYAEQKRAWEAPDPPVR